MTDKTPKPAPVYKTAAQEELRRTLDEQAMLFRQRHQLVMQRDDFDLQIKTIDARLVRLTGKVEGADLGQRVQSEVFENEKTRREQGVE